jgi:parallel beta-helix repeat protein
VLEDRVLFNAAPVGELPADSPDATTMGANEIMDLLDFAVDATSEEIIAETTVDEASSEQDGDLDGSRTQTDGEFTDHLDETEATESRFELIFVDETVEDYQAFVNDIQQRDPGSTRYEVIQLSSDESGIARITAVIRGQEGIDAVHLVSHGSADAVHLGSDRLTTENVDRYAWQIEEWQFAFDSDADLLIYGCDLASSDEGQQLLETLSATCGCDVAASVDDTGHAIFGGDWDLEYETGAIETAVVLSPELQSSWFSLLAPSSPGTAIWRQSGDNSPQYNEWNGTTFTGELNSASVGDWRIIQGAEAPTRDEIIVLGVASGSGTIAGEFWNGSSWNPLPMNPLGSNAETFWWSMDVAYESQSGDAILVFTDGGDVEFATWDGGSGSLPASIGIYAGGTPRQLQLAASPNADEMVLIVSDTDDVDTAYVWDGSTWDAPSAITLATNSSDDKTDIYVIYEQQSGDAMVVYSDNNSDLRYRIWDGSWNSEQTLSKPAGVSGKVRWTTLASDPSSDQIALGVTTFNDETWLGVWDGSSWFAGSTVLATNQTGVQNAPNVAVAFESGSGDALATYGENSPSFRYRTWTSSVGWSAEQTGTNLGDNPNSMTLSSDSAGDHIMLSVQDDSMDIHYILWDGAVDSWGTDNELETNSGENKNQPFVFLFSNSTTATVLDQFNAVSYNGNDGTQNWTNDWQELNDDGLPSGGPSSNINVLTTAQMPGSNALRVGSRDNQPSSAELQREADLTGATTALLTFKYRRDSNDGYYANNPIVLEVSDDGGFSWNPVDSWNNGEDATIQNGNYDISAYIASDTTIRFRETATVWVDGYIYFDNIQIEHNGAAPTNTLVVDTTSDVADGDASSISSLLASPGADGFISLREAIVATNNTANLGGPDEIHFNIGGGGPRTIEPASALPGILDPVVIDGTTQPGFVGSPLIEIDGASAGLSTDGLSLQADSNTIRSLSITNFGKDGIAVQTTSNTIAGNYIGVDPAGNAAGNVDDGIDFHLSSGANTVGGSTAADRNVIADSGNDGIEISGGVQTVIGNFIGTDPTGALPYGNGDDGIDIGGGANHVIGQPGNGNIIVNSGTAATDQGSGVFIDGGVQNVVIQGNLIGTNDGHGTGLGNEAGGVHLQNAGTGNIIGGAAAMAGNVIVSDQAHGIVIENTGGTFVYGNSIGTDDMGAAGLGNLSGGIKLDLAASNTIGGSAAGEGNVIAGNNGPGIEFAGNTSDDNIVRGNAIGTDLSAMLVLPNNGAGILLGDLTNNNQIGGTASGEENLIANNNGAGIAVTGPTTNNNSLLGNQIFNNSGLGIDLGSDSVTPNDPGDSDTGPNELLNFPVLTDVLQNGSNLDIDFDLDVAAGNYRIEFYDNPSGLDPSGHGEGAVLLGAKTVMHTGSGVESFSETLISVTPSNPGNVTSTATEDGGGGNFGNTSEFGPAASSLLIVDTTNDIVDGDTSSISALLGDKGSDGFVSLREAIIATNNTAGADTFSLPSGTYTLAIGSSGEDNSAEGDLDITDDLTIDGAGAKTTIIDANGIDRVLHAVSGNALINGVTITGGVLNQDGGGVHNDATLTLTDAALTNNSAAGKNGGALHNDGNVTLARVTISGNDAAAGAGIFTHGAAALSLTNVTISGNLATNEGGGLHTNHAVSITNSTIAYNEATNGAAGVYADGTITLRNTIFAENRLTDTTPQNVDPRTALNSLGFNIDSDGTAGIFGIGDQSGTVPMPLDVMLGALQDNGGFTETHQLLAGSIAIDQGTATGAPAVDQRGVVRPLDGDGDFIATVDVGAFEFSAPTITLSGGVVSYIEGDPATVLDSGATVSDPDSPDFDTGMLTVEFAAGGTANDRLAIEDQGIGLGEIGVSGMDVTYEGTVIGTFTGGDDGMTPLIVTLDIDADVPATQALLRAITYQNVGVDPDTDPRTINFTLTDGDGGTSNVAGKIVNVAGDQILAVTTAADTLDGDTSSIDALLADRGVDGFISLREAIEATNNTANGATPDEIHFNIAGPGPHTIAAASALPDITDGLIIDGTTEPDFGGSPVIVVDGNTTTGSTDGLKLETGSEGSTIRGLVVNQFARDGISVRTSGNTIAGNYIGTDVTGLIDLGNGTDGIYIANGASNNIIGGTASADRNIISGNNDEGIEVRGSTSSGNQILGNYIGVGSDGMSPLGNDEGIWVQDAPNTVIGGVAAGATNVIGANNSGIIVSGDDATGTVVQGNFIGTDVTDTVDLGGSFYGILFYFTDSGPFFLPIGDPSNSTIGGVNPGEGNTIANWNLDGVNVGFGTGHSVRGNVIRSNGDLGIDLTVIDGVTLNDTGDGDSGANELQNFPVLSAAVSAGGNTLIAGSLNSNPSTSFTIDFYSNPSADPSGHGEGQVYLGTDVVTTDASGNAAISTVLMTGVSLGQVVTATATDSSNNTSEFSETATVVNNVLVVDTTSDGADGDTSSIAALIANRGVDQAISLHEAVAATNNTANGVGPDEIRFNIPLDDPNHFYYQDDLTPGALSSIATTTLGDGSISDFDPDYPAGFTRSWYRIQPSTELAITDPVIIDGTTQLGYITGAPVIEIDAVNVMGADPNAIALRGGASTIRGLVINRSPDQGLEVDINGGNTIEGNYVGTDVSGTIARGNVWGIGIKSNDNTLGGTTLAARNIISGNTDLGIDLYNSASNNTIQGNYIGTDVTGAIGVPNGTAGMYNDGIWVGDGSSNTMIGGTLPGQGNVIAYNVDRGVTIDGTAGNGTTIRGNSIFSNGALGIDLNEDGVTANDAGDPDGGPNTLQNFPVLLSADSAGGNTTITGSLNSSSLTTFAIDFYSSPTADPTGFGEGQVLLGSDSVVTDASGNATINTTLIGVSVTAGDVVTATAVDPSGNTSEFAMNVVATATGQLVVDTISDVLDGDTSSIANLIGDKGADGFISLREAITATNNTANGGTPDEIHFNISGGGPHTISLASVLPQLTDSVIIDGTTEPDFSGAPIIELDGTLVTGDGLVVTSAGPTTIRGLVINRFAGDGVELQTGGHLIEGNYIGTDPSGMVSLGNTGEGILVQVGADNNTIGGTTAVARNVISGNNHGIRINSSGNVVSGNYVGLDATGTLDRGNSNDGILVENGGANNMIGGTAAGAGNVVSGNNNGGVVLHTNVVNNTVQGNYVGTNAGGSSAIGNSTGGIRVTSGAMGNLIGGTSVGAGNVISGNLSDGLQIEDSATTGTVVQGNLIGVDAMGVSAVPNAVHGIHITDADDNSIGGIGPGEANLIAENLGAGIAVTGTADGNSWRGNQIHSNNQLGIDLGDDGVTSNDAGDSDAGQNNLQNFPVLLTADSAGGNTTIAGTLNSAASTTFNIDYYSSPTADPTGFGEAQVYLGSDAVTTDASGDAIINTVLTGVSVTAGHAVTATATDPSGNTSELSMNVVATATGLLVVDTVSDALDGDTASITSLIGNKGADGFISLREAITATNNTANGSTPDEIHFSIAGGGPHTIQVGFTGLQGLPDITDPVVIDGTTDPDFAGTPIIELDGSNVTVSDNGLQIVAGNSTIRGLVINGFMDDGIDIETNGSNTIVGNHIGTNVLGDMSIANGGNGIAIQSDNNVIGGTTAADRNLISGNIGPGIRLNLNASGNVIQGNYIGTVASGSTSLPNSGDGILIEGNSNSNTIGGAAPGAGNVISGNFGDGISLQSDNNTVQGNLIGTNATGTSAIGNGVRGIEIDSASGNLIGGSTASTRNVISGNGDAGVLIFGPSATGNTIKGNYIGPDISGTLAIGNTDDGIRLESGASNNTIGGASAGEGNVISDNGDEGIEIFGIGSANNLVLGNYIGTAADGITALGNAGDGVLHEAGSTNNQIGGTVVGEGNIIAFNAWGIGNIGANTTSNAFRGNSIHSNNQLGIDLADGVVTLNDPGDLDVGTNELQNFPVLATAVSTGGNTTITGSLNSTASATFNIDFYSSPAADGSGYGEGQIYLGSDMVTTDASGNATINAALAVNVTLGDVVTATATNPSNSTSEFSLGITATGQLIVDTTNDVSDGDTSSIGNLLANKGADGFISLREAITAANNTANLGSPDEIHFNITGGGPHTIQPTTALPIISDAVIIDGSTEPDFAGTPIVELDGSLVGGIVDGLHFDSGNNVVRGLVINRFTDDGIELSMGSGSMIEGNYIGLDVTGTMDLGNADDGISIRSGSNNNVIGGTTATARNVIAGNEDDGIDIFGTSGNIVRGNFIGVDVSGAIDIGNTEHGVELRGGGATNNTIGGTGAGAGNLIAFNDLDGVHLISDVGTGNRIAGNAIHSNSLLGIDLRNPLGPNTNDPGDGDTGANDLQNHPVLTSAVSAGPTVTIDGTLNSTPSTAFRIEFFANTAADPSGRGEAQRYLGFINTLTDASGDAIFNAAISATVSVGEFVSATATDASNNTSELAQNVVATASSVLIVDTTSDVADGDTASITALLLNKGVDGFISLREAITATNNTANVATPDEIRFNIAGSGPHTIQPTSALPTVSDSVVIDGTTEPDFTGTPIIELDGSLTAFGDGLQISAGGSTIRGLVINRFMDEGIELGVLGGNLIVGNYIGTDTTGTVSLPNHDGGIDVNSPNNTIGGPDTSDRNVISGNLNGGVNVSSTGTGTVIRGNYIGLNAAGSGALGNAVANVLLSSVSDVTIGGTAAGDGNVISASNGPGIWLLGSSGNVIKGNLIGTDASGSGDLGNAGEGVRIEGASGSNTIGGTTAAARNVISGNDADGIYITGSGASGNIVAGNFIGTDILGNSPLGNAVYGVWIANGASDNTVGGPSSAHRNIISANGDDGVRIEGGNSSGNFVASNYIGTDVNGSALLGNGDDGIVIDNAPNNLIGDTGMGNLISGNTDKGILIGGGNSSGTAVFANIIGLNALGNADLGNTNEGIQIFSSANNVVIGKVGGGNIISGNDSHGIEVVSGSGITIQGNTIGTDVSGTLSLQNDKSGIRVSTSTTNANIVIGGDQPGEGNLVAHNFERGIHLTGPGAGDQIIGNTVTQQGWSGIKSERPETTVAKNLIHNNSVRAGFTFDELVLGASQTVYHNTIHGAADDGISIEANGSVLKNNSVTGSASFGINLNGSFTIAEETHNLITDATTAPANLGGQISSGSLDATDINADPQYTNAGAGDFTLTEPTSPAIEAGQDLGAAQPDLNGPVPGLFNGSAPDIGAFESGTTNTPPNATNMTRTKPYLEDAASVNIDDIVVTDPDVGDTITAELTLADTSTGTLSASSGNGESYNAGTGIWTISGIVSQVNAALAAVAFLPSPDNDVDTTITTHIEDALGSGPSDGTITLDVTPVNDAPVVDLNGLAAGNGFGANFTEDGGPVAIVDAANASITDVDSTTLDSLTVTITNPLDAPIELLDTNAVAGITETYDAETGTLTLTGTALLTDYVTVLRGITYDNSSQDPTTASRSVDFVANDGSDNSNPESASVGVTAQNDPPVADDEPVAYSPLLGPLALNPVGYWRLGESGPTNIAVDATTLNNGFYRDGTTLGEPGAIAADADTGARFSSSGTPDYVEIPHHTDYLIDNGSVQLWFNADDISLEAGLFSKDSSGYDEGGHFDIQLRNSKVEVRLQEKTGPGTGVDHQIFSVDPLGDSEWHHVAVTFGSQGLKLYLDGKAQDTNPYVGGLGPNGFGTGNEEPIALGAESQASGNQNLTGLRDYFDGAIDEVAFFNYQLSAEDIGDLFAAGLHNYVVNEGGLLTTTSAAGVLTNDFDFDADPLTASIKTLPSFASSFALNADGSFTYGHNGSESPSDSFTYEVDDGSGNKSLATVSITVDGINDDPSISLPGGPVSYTESDPLTIIDAAATVGDVDSPDFDSGTLTVDFTAAGTVDDRLAIRNEGVGLGQISIVGADVRYNFAGAPIVIGNFGGGTNGSDPLVVTLNTNADQSATEALLRNVAYENVSNNPSTTSRTVRFVLTDGDGGTSNVELATIDVTTNNLAPSAQTDSYSVNSGETLNVDATQGVLANDSDPDADPITANVTSGPTNGTLLLQPDGSFVYTPNPGEVGDDQFTYVANDGSLNSAATTVTIAINPVGPGGEEGEGGGEGEGEGEGGEGESGEGEGEGEGEGGGEGDGDPTGPEAPGPDGGPRDVTNNPPSLQEPPGGRDEGGEFNFRPIETPGGPSLLVLSISDAYRQVHERFGGSETTILPDELVQLGGVISTSLQLVSSELAFVAQASSFWDDLDTLEQIAEQEIYFEAAEFTTIAGISTSLMAGYVVWVLRGGFLVTALLTQMPAWAMVNPLPIFDGREQDEDDQEDLASMLESSNEDESEEQSGEAEEQERS